MKNTIIAVVAGIVILGAIVLGITLSKKPQVADPVISKPTAETLKSFAVFSEPVSADVIGFANFSPDGKYFAYSAFTDGENPANQGHIVNLKTGVDTAVGGMLSRGFWGNNYLTVFNLQSMPSLYNATTGETMTIPSGVNTFDVFVSPNGKRAVGNGDGLMVVDLATNQSKTLDAKMESAGWAWFSDSNRIVGLKENTENLFEAGRGRDLGIWNTDTGTFTKIPGTFNIKSLRYIEWLVPDRVVRVNAGYDDGSYDYLVNVETNQVIDLGETSWALMGGIVTDSKLGVMAAIGSGGAGDCVRYNECKGFIADQTGKISEFQLPRDQHRSSLQIISKTKLLYISRDLGEEGGYGTTYVTMYDTETKQQTRIQEVPNMNIVSLALSPDKSVWVVGAGNQFIVGEIK